MSKEKQIEEMIEEIKPFVSGFACGEESGSCELTDCRTCKARNLANGIYNAGYRKQSESVWYFYSQEVECHGPNGVTKKQVTGWICGNCKKYSTGIRNFCPECGAKMKGGE